MQIDFWVRFPRPAVAREKKKLFPSTKACIHFECVVLLCWDFQTACRSWLTNRLCGGAAPMRSAHIRQLSLSFCDGWDILVSWWVPSTQVTFPGIVKKKKCLRKKFCFGKPHTVKVWLWVLEVLRWRSWGGVLAKTWPRYRTSRNLRFCWEFERPESKLNIWNPSQLLPGKLGTTFKILPVWSLVTIS